MHRSAAAALSLVVLLDAVSACSVLRSGWRAEPLCVQRERFVPCSSSDLTMHKTHLSVARIIYYTSIVLHFLRSSNSTHFPDSSYDRPANELALLLLTLLLLLISRRASSSPSSTRSQWSRPSSHSSSGTLTRTAWTLAPKARTA